MIKTFTATATLCGLAVLAAEPAYAQEAGETVVRVAASRTKLVDKGEIKVDGTLDPTAGYETRETYHGTVSATYFPIGGVGIDASISTPATTNNIPAGSLAGTPNLGDDEFVMATLGARLQPLQGGISPYVAGGIQFQFTTQERDGLGVDLNIPSTSGPYVEGGVEFDVTPRFGLFVSARKAWYHTNASGLLPLDATYTNFAQIDAKAQLDPVTLQIGGLVRFGRKGTETAPTGIEADTSRWTIRGGVTSLSLADRVDLEVGGAPLPGAALSTFEHATPTVQIGYFVLPNVAVNAMLGVPPKIDVYGGGSIGALPVLGQVTYGPMALTAQYHPLRRGVIRPWLGAGVSYMVVFGTEDGAFEDLDVSNDFGAVFEAGTDFMIDSRWSLFAEAKKAFLRPTATGTFGGEPVVGKTRLDPWAFTVGGAVRF